MATITEGLAEIRTLAKRIEKKREFVGRYIWRLEGHKDPLDKDGGSVTALSKERQAIRDLEQRIVDLRRAITVANMQNEITIGDTTRSIYDWLTWRREVSDGGLSFLGKIQSTLGSIRQEASRRNVSVHEGHGQDMSDVVVNVSESDLAAEVEYFEEVLGQLDGMLSLKNATIVIEA